VASTILISSSVKPYRFYTSWSIFLSVAVIWRCLPPCCSAGDRFLLAVEVGFLELLVKLKHRFDRYDEIVVHLHFGGLPAVFLAGIVEVDGADGGGTGVKYTSLPLKRQNHLPSFLCEPQRTPRLPQKDPSGGQVRFNASRGYQEFTSPRCTTGASPRN